MPVKVTAHVRCDFCGTEKDIDISRVPMDIGWKAYKAIYATHGFRKEGRVCACDECHAAFDDAFGNAPSLGAPRH